MSSHIVIDVRRSQDFGIGTYIRSLVHALSRVDRQNHYTLVGRWEDDRGLAGLPENFRTEVYNRDDAAALDHNIAEMAAAGLFAVAAQVLIAATILL